MTQRCRAFTWTVIHFLLLGKIFFPLFFGIHLSGVLVESIIIVALECRMDFGIWTESNRNSYNKWDAISKCTTEVCDTYPPSYIL